MSILPAGTIVFDDVSKRYRLGALGSLRSTVAALSSRGREENGARDFWALKDVSFRVKPGESLGLIGPNGAGKTTTLKLLSNITRPTSGRIEIGGRMSSLIELGAGFHPELSGRDNIFLNGAILGLSRREIQRKLDEIIAFSELERFIDTPVKRYSSGMYVRLGFAVAAHIEPDVLLVDEVLAVGDSAFRQKCMTRMEALRANGTTLLFVSHNMYQVRRLCQRALLLLQGKSAFLGASDSAITAYEESIQLSARRPSEGPTLGEDSLGRIMITGVTLHDAEGQTITRLHHDQPLDIRASYSSSEVVVDPIAKIRLVRADGAIAALAASHHGPGFQWTPQAKGVIHARLNPIQLTSGSYVAEVRIADNSDTGLLASGQSDPIVILGPGMLHEPDPGAFVPNVVWSHEAEGMALN